MWIENGVAFLQVQPLGTRYGLARPKTLLHTRQQYVKVGRSSRRRHRPRWFVHSKKTSETAQQPQSTAEQYVK